MVINENDFKLLNKVRALKGVDNYFLYQIFYIILRLGKENKSNDVNLIINDVMFVVYSEELTISIIKESKKHKNSYYPDKGFHILETISGFNILWDKRISPKEVSEILAEVFIDHFESYNKSETMKNIKKQVIKCN